jgi:hypothetical protein
MGFALLKKLLIEKNYYLANETCLVLSREKKDIISEATDLKTVYETVGEDFWVVCPCISSVYNTVLLEGTRLTLCKKLNSEGYDFSIRSPGLPSRWSAMDKELDACFTTIVQQLILLKRINRLDLETSNNLKIRETANIQIIREALRLFFYWVNFAPLTRGSAMCGYAAVMAVVLASNRKIISSIPKGKQLDWEAIFTSDSNDFIKRFENSIETEPSDFVLSEDVDFDKAMPTLFDALQALLL